MPDLVPYTAVLPIGESTVAFVSGLLTGERARRRIRRCRRALSFYWQAIMAHRWFLDGTRIAQLALDNQASGSTAYRYLHEAIDVLAAAAPSLHSALLAARIAGYSYAHLAGADPHSNEFRVFVVQFGRNGLRVTSPNPSGALMPSSSARRHKFWRVAVVVELMELSIG